METPTLPDWAQARINQLHGVRVTFLTVKTLDALDLSRFFNRFLLSEEANFILRSYLTEEGREKMDSLYLEDGDYSDLNIRRNNKGLDVFVYFKESEERLQLSSWDGDAIGCNIKGPEWWPLPDFYKLQVGDKVAIWMFRRTRADKYGGKLCFIISKV